MYSGNSDIYYPDPRCRKARQRDSEEKCEGDLSDLPTGAVYRTPRQNRRDAGSSGQV